MSTAEVMEVVTIQEVSRKMRPKRPLFTEATEPTRPKLPMIALMRDTVDLAIMDENIRQLQKWGLQNHEPFKWLSILGEEVGESHKAALDRFDFRTGEFSPVGLEHLRIELIQVAAVAKAFVECLDRGEWK